MIESIIIFLFLLIIFIAIIIGLVLSAISGPSYDPYDILLDAEITKIKKKDKYLSDMDRKGGKSQKSGNRPPDPKGSNQNG